MTAGGGKDVLLLHGYLSSKESFYYQTKFLSGSFKVTVPDMPGFGASSPLDKAYSVGDYCRWLDGFIKYCKLDRPHIIAHSFGARVALKYLSENPQGADKLIITGGAGIVKARSPQYMRRVKAYRRIKKIFPKFAEKHFGSKEYRTLSPIMRESYKKIVNEDLREDAKKIQVPVLFLYGDRDTETPLSSARVYHACVKDSRLRVLENCGHFAHLDNALAFNLAAEEFFK